MNMDVDVMCERSLKVTVNHNADRRRKGGCHNTSWRKSGEIVGVYYSPTEASEVNLIKDGNFFQVKFLWYANDGSLKCVVVTHDENPSCQRSTLGRWAAPVRRLNATLSEFGMFLRYGCSMSLQRIWNVEERNSNFGSIESDILAPG